MSFSMASLPAKLTHAINYAASRGVISIASAGNTGREVVVFPAALRNVLGVASTTIADQRAAFTNYGDSLVELAAPGESLITTYPGGRYAAAWGTSFSTALISGGAALLAQVKPGITHDDASDQLEQGAVQGNGLDLGQ